MNKARIVVLVLILMVVAGSVFAAPMEQPRMNIVRVNLGGLIVGPWTSIYGVDIAYERIISDRLGWNLSTWFLNDFAIWGVGFGTSLDLFVLGNAPSGLFLNFRTGVVSGEIYSRTVWGLQTGLSIGVQSVFPGGFVLRVGTGTSYVIGYGFVPRSIVSVGYAF